MTKQHFTAIANVLRNQMDSARYTDEILTPALSGEKILTAQALKFSESRTLPMQLADQTLVFNPTSTEITFLRCALAETCHFTNHLLFGDCQPCLAFAKESQTNQKNMIDLITFILPFSILLLPCVVSMVLAVS